MTVVRSRIGHDGVETYQVVYLRGTLNIRSWCIPESGKRPAPITIVQRYHDHIGDKAIRSSQFDDDGLSQVLSETKIEG